MTLSSGRMPRRASTVKTVITVSVTSVLTFKRFGVSFFDIYFGPGTAGTGSIVGNADCVVTFRNESRNDLTIRKVDEVTRTPLEGAGFRVFAADGTVVGEGYTDEDGLLTFDNLLYGKYTYQEFEAPEGYELNKEVCKFPISGDGEVIRVTRENRPETGKITIYKIDENGDPLPGAEFLLEYSLDDGETWTPIRYRNPDESPITGATISKISKNGTLTTDANGIATFGGLVIDNAMERVRYRITEVNTKDGYASRAHASEQNILNS